MDNPVSMQVNGVARKKFISGVYSWMMIALCLSGAFAYLAASNVTLQRVIFGNSLVFYGLIFGELAVVFLFSATISKVSVPVAALQFIVYSIINGLTLGSVFLVYSGESIASVFLITAGMFACMSIYGRTTKTDLSSAGRYLMMALFGIIIASLVNIFMRSSGLQWVISLVTVGVFTGLTAYDTQKIMRIAEHADDSESFAKVAILGALELYLDFINIFLALLRLFGKSRN